MTMMWNWYKSVLRQHPLVTKATTACGLMSVSDILCQTVEHSMHRQILLEHGPTTNLQGGCPTNIALATSDASLETTQQKLIDYDWTRTLHVGLTGATFSGPISHAWYGILERIVVTTSISGGVAVKMILDAMLFSPIAVAGYFIWRSQFEGRGWDGTWQKLESKWSSAVVASWSFWPLANIINFSMVPVHFRVLYNNVLSLFWNGYLSNINNERLNKVIVEKKQAKTIEEVHTPDVCICPHCRPLRG